MPGSLIRATVTVALVVAVIAVAGGCLLATAPRAHAGETRRLAPLSSASVIINSVSPQVAQPGGTVTMTGTVTNESRSALSGVAIQLRSDAAPLSSRDSLASYANGTLHVDTPVGTPVPVTGNLPSGATAQWRVSLSVTSIGIAAFGVYPLAAEAVDAIGLPVGTARTFLPFWPGAAASGMSQRLKVAWVWPLLNAPQQGICPQLSSNSLAASIAPGEPAGHAAGHRFGLRHERRPDLGGGSGPAAQCRHDDACLPGGRYGRLHRRHPAQREPGRGRVAVRSACGLRRPADVHHPL